MRYGKIARAENAGVEITGVDSIAVISTSRHELQTFQVITERTRV